MRLADLRPKLAGTLERGVLVFDCPLASDDHGHHRHRVAVHRAPFAEIDGVKHWRATGDFPDSLTLSPSVDAGPTCWHGFITNGEIK